MADTAKLVGLDDIASWLQETGTPSPGFGGEGGEFVEAFKAGDYGQAFGDHFIPAVAEQSGQLLGSLGSRIAGAGLGAALGSAIPGAGTIGGAAVGAFAGPFLFEAVQIAGPTAYDLARKRGKPEPDWEDMLQALATASASGSLNALGARYLPGGAGAIDNMLSSFGANVARAGARGALGELGTETLQEIVQQTGSTFNTPGGLSLDPTEALAVGTIGMGAGGTAGVAVEAASTTFFGSCRGYSRIRWTSSSTGNGCSSGFTSRAERSIR